MLRQIILDVETTGLEPEKGHRIIEIGCLEMINRLLTGKSFHLYLNPEREIERDAEMVHGITQAFLADKPKFMDIADDLVAFIRGAELIIHNAPFDVGFLNVEFKRLKKKFSPVDKICDVIDTLAIARKKHPGQPNSLDALCRRYHVDNTNRSLHGALLDAELLAQVYLLLTGGQEQLFRVETEASTTKHRDVSIRRLSSDRPPLRVIHASADELSAHKKLIEKLRCADSSL